MYRTRRLSRLLVYGAAVGVPVPAAAAYFSTRAPDFVPAAQTVPIVRDVDGDTVLARVDGKNQRIRVLGMNTPETHDPQKPGIECYGPQASANASRWIRSHRTVVLRADPAAPNRDRYGRLLRYVAPTDKGPDLSTVQLDGGYARVLSLGEYLAELPALKAAERRARRAHRGLWGHCS